MISHSVLVSLSELIVDKSNLAIVFFFPVCNILTPYMVLVLTQFYSQFSAVKEGKHALFL